MPKRGTLRQAFGWAFSGVAYVIRTQRNMRIHLVVAVLAVALGLILHLNVLEWVAVLVCIALVWGTEMLNTAIEVLVDLVTPDYHEKAKAAKDIAAGVTLIFVILSVVVGLIVYTQALLRLLGQ